MDRVRHAWANLAGEQRLAAVAAFLLLATLFLPWYEKSFYDRAKGTFVEDKLSGFGSADFVMASVVLVAVGVLALLFARGEQRAFHLPGGDGLIVMIAGGWAALLIFYRVLDHPDVTGDSATIGIQWGVFIAFLAAAFLVYAGYRIRAAHRPEPPLPAAGDDVAFDLPPRTRRRGERPRRAAPAPPAAESPGVVARPVDEAPTRRVAPDEPPAEAPTRRLPSEAPAEPAPAPRRRRPAGDEPPMPGQLSFDEAETQHLPDR
ncbi:MAG: hypothetical protein IRZ32_09075 [Solirubrobacteraceae bacterium]|nr:hypothetical protein [Solirubrobacteraceae bacterium]